MFVEDEYTELKQELTKDIKKEIIAFANTNGGKIYIGVDDNGNAIGLKNIKEDIEALSSMIKEGITTDLTLYTKISQEKINNKIIIRLDIMEAPNKPYYLTEKGIKPSGVYLRLGNTSIPASEEIIKKMINESQNNSFETIISKTQNLTFDYTKSVFEKHNIELSESKMKTLNIINLKNEYTNLGLLLSDECPFSIKCAIFNGKNKLEFRDRREFEGSILKQVNDTFEFLELINKTKGEIVGLERIDTRDYPIFALRESLLNAIIHRDYNYTGSILISVFDDRIEITSLGGLVKGLEINDIYSGISETRNSNLSNIFYRLKYVESFGTGIGRIIESYEGFSKKPEFLITENTFKTVLYNVNYKDDIEENKNDMNEEETIVDYLKSNKRINRKTIEEISNVSSTKAKNILSEMVKNNVLNVKGNGKNTYYTLK